MTPAKPAAPEESRDTRKPLRLSDPKSIRALAHPARLAVIEELYSGGAELTATECAELVGLSPSAMSYHLRSLEKAGIVERAPGSGDGRERPWRASGRHIQVEADESTAAATAASDALGDVVLTRVITKFTEYMARRTEEPKRWRDAFGVSAGQVWLTVEEAEAVQHAALDALRTVRGRTQTERPDGSRRVRYALISYPSDRMAVGDAD